ncbi:MAG: T9SS type A sorting domain-containing protein, partial [Bacteroidales bacterium]|nr:T9SS type A sorting domain-containing protein [Bacteroidales bacterium]
YDGSFGNGVTGHWFGEDANGWGVVHMGETAACNASVIPQLSLLQDITVDFEVKGEVYGGTPHDVFGSIPMRNLGPVVEWLSLDTNAGILAGGETGSLNLTLSTEGMEDGNYQAWIILQDNFQGETIIPVNLTLDTYLGNDGLSKIQETISINASPNPFKDKTTIKASVDQPVDITLHIFNSQGLMVRSEIINHNVKDNNIQYTWDGRTDAGLQLPSGVYLLRITAAGSYGFARLIIIR